MCVDLMFGQRLDMTSRERDDLGLIDAVRSSAVLTGLMAMYPYIFNPLKSIPGIKRLLFPRSTDQTGIGNVMAVNLVLALKRCGRTSNHY